MPLDLAICVMTTVLSVTKEAIFCVVIVKCTTCMNTRDAKRTLSHSHVERVMLLNNNNNNKISKQKFIP